MDFLFGMDFPTEIETSDVSESNTTTDDLVDPETQKKYKMMMSMWLSFCLFGFIWFVNKVLKGRQRMRYNFASIEEQLKRMQAAIEEKERAENAICKNGGQEANNEGNNQQVSDQNGGEAVAKVSPDAQKLLESLTKAFGKTESEDNLENVEERDEIEEVQDFDKENVEEVNGNVSNDDDEMAMCRRRGGKFIDLDEKVDLVQDAREDIIQEKVNVVAVDGLMTKKHE